MQEVISKKGTYYYIMRFGKDILLTIKVLLKEGLYCRNYAYSGVDVYLEFVFVISSVANQKSIIFFSL